MNGKHYVGLDLTGFEDNGQARPISRVTLMVDDGNAVTAGDDTGVELAAECPHATQAMVNAILKSVKGYAYKMYSAAGASLDPAAELGDGITTGGVYSVIAAIDDDGTYPDVAAPGEQEMEDEYPTEGPVTRRFNRQIADTRSSITKTAEQIRLEVETAYATKGELGAAESRLSSSISQTAESIVSEVKETYATKGELGTAQKTLSSEIEQTVKGIKLSVTNGASSSTLTLKSGETTLSSASITFTGLVNFVSKSDIYSSGKTTIDGGKITAGSISADKLSVTDLSALDATIGGWTIGTGLTYNDGTYMGGFRPNNTINVLYIGHKDEEGEHYPFVLKRDGSLKATDAEIAGKITATEGKIGGFTIGASAIYNGLSTLGGLSDGVYVGTDGISLGGGKFKVTKEGVLTAKSGTVGGFTIDSSAIYDDDHSSLVGDVRLSKTMFTRTIGGTERSSLRFAIGENFAVNNNGVVYASNVHLKGEVTATGGAIGGWDIGSNGISYTSEDGLHLVTVRPIQSSASLPVIYIGRREKETDGWSIPFRVNGDGTCSATDFKISGGSTFSGGLDGATGSISGVTGSYDGSIDSGGTFSGTHSGGSLSGTGGSFGGTVSSGVLSGCNLGGTSLAVTSGGSSNISSYLNGIRMYGPSNAHVMAGSVSLSLSSAGIYDNTNFHASGNISCNGEKSRAIGTEHFGTRLLSAFETPLPTFSDYGTATLDESGVCYICIDPVFAETVNGNCLPTVFLTPYGEGALYVDKVEHDVVTVRGTPGLRFAWETRYAQTNAYVQRLKVMDFDMPDRSGEHDFDSEAAVDLEHTAPDIIVSAQNYLTSYAARAVDYGQAGYEYYTEFERRLTA